MVSRFREELAAGVEVDDAVARTTATAGRTIAFSALTVAAALAALLVFPLYFLRSFAYAGIGVMIISAASRPARAAGPARRARSPGQRRPAALAPKPVRSVEAPFWATARSGRDAPPALTALPVLAVLLLLATPAALASPSAHRTNGSCPTSAASHQVGDALRTDFATTTDGRSTCSSHPPFRRSELVPVTRCRASPTLSGVHAPTSAPLTQPAGGPTTQRISLSTGLDSGVGRQPRTWSGRCGR